MRIFPHHNPEEVLEALYIHLHIASPQTENVEVTSAKYRASWLTGFERTGNECFVEVIYDQATRVGVVPSPRYLWVGHRVIDRMVKG